MKNMKKLMKQCKNKECTNNFNPVTSLQKYCFECTISKAKKQIKTEKDKEWRTKKKELKEKIKTVTDYRKQARYWFQRWIRIRDLGKTCISCPTLLTDIRDYHAGHMLQANNYPQLLFNEFAVNGQCIHCNKYRSGNESEYRKGVSARYGINVLLDLEKLAEDKTTRNLTKEHYTKVETEYKKRCKDIEKQNCI